MKRHREAVEREVASHPGVSLHWEDRGKHEAAVLTVGARTHRIIISRSASCHRAALNQRGDVRRAIRNLKGEA